MLFRGERRQPVSYFPVTAGAHPHDVAAAPDGTVWYTAQRQGALGILDPKTGKVEQVPLGKGAAPHGVIAGPDGAAWITEGGQNAIARVDPKSRDGEAVSAAEGLRERQPQHRDLRQERHALVHRAERRLRPRRSGERQGRGLEGAEGLGPYGITTTPSGEVWYASLAGDHIARIDTATGAATVVDPPKPGVGPRRIWSDSKGMLWVSFWHAGRARPLRSGREELDERTRCRRARAAATRSMSTSKDKVWVTDFVANAILRFDPATEKFDSFPVEQARRRRCARCSAAPGEAWGAESGTDRLVVVRY